MNVKVNGVDFDDIEAAFRSGRRLGKTETTKDLSRVVIGVDPGVEIIAPQACRRCGGCPPKLDGRHPRDPLTSDLVAVKRSRDARGAA